MIEMPEIKYGQQGKVVNWDELCRWACDNDSLWKACKDHATQFDMSDDDTLKFLAVHQLKVIVEQFNRRIQEAKTRTTAQFLP